MVEKLSSLWLLLMIKTKSKMRLVQIVMDKQTKQVRDRVKVGDDECLATV
jgi:hypothetical protein